MTRSNAPDCCPGEPCMGDPKGMHTLDCPVYLRWADADVARTRELELQRQRQRPPSDVELAYQAGYRRGLKEGRQGRG